jgi:glycosyltransferase involved in cell wall biosynthesis
MLYLLHSGNLYGTERMALATLLGLTEYDRRVVFAPRPYGDGSVAEAAREAGLEAITVETRWDLVRRLLPWFLRYRAIDVIGTGVAQSFICYFLAKLFFVRLRQLQVTHGGTSDLHAYGRKRLLNRIPIGVVAVSDFVRERLIQHGVRPDAVHVVNNFLIEGPQQTTVERGSYLGDGARPRPVEPSRVKVAVVSRVDAIKRIDLLVEAVESGVLAHFDFDIYGTGTDIDTLRARAARHANVRFHGFVGDVQGRLAEADLLLHLCPEEPFGLVVLEAFRAGLVVVVPDAGGAGGLVEDGVNGLRFRAGDAADLCRVLLAARQLPAAVMQRLADAGRAALEQRYCQREGVRGYRSALQAQSPR